MEIRDFLNLYHEAFGENARPPLALVWTDATLGEPEGKNPCMFASLGQIMAGRPASFAADTKFCGGGKIYCGFAKPNAAVGKFVAGVEHYKATPESVLKSIEMRGIAEPPARYATFLRLDMLDSWNGVEGVIFMATPDMLSGLWSWANFDIEKDDSIIANFGSGCASIVSNIMRENRNNGYRCFIGMLDVSVRPFMRANEVAFSIPRSRLLPMLETFQDTCLFKGKAWGEVRERMRGVAE